MNKLTGSIAAKLSAIILSYVMAAVLVLSVLGIIFMVDTDYYTKSRNKVIENVLTGMAASESYKVNNLYDNNNTEHSISSLKSYYSDKNIYFTISDSDGNVICSNYNGEDYLALSRGEDYGIYESVEITEENGEYYTTEKQVGTVVVDVYVAKNMVNTDRFSLTYNLINTTYSLKYSVFAFALISLISIIVLLSFLYCAAGRRKGSEKAQLNFLDRLPFDIYTGLMIFAAAIAVLTMDNGYYSAIVMVVIAFSVLTVGYFLFLAYTMSFATRVKTKTLFTNTIIYRLIAFFGKGLKKGFGTVGYLIKNLSLVKKTLLILAGIIFVEFIFVMASMYYPGAVVFWWVIFTGLFAAAVLYIAITLQKIKQGGEKISSGELDYKIDTKYMYYDFKDFAESLNNINFGLQSAVNEKMKSERFKTELITNVSHDIKTPLTSIINYVDLIKKEEPESEVMQQYIDVLDRQSGRLKKLIEDLVEASKASTGNLAVNLSECEVGVLLSQTIGEFDERLAKAELTPVLKQPEKSIRIMADGRHLWRVFDNLMSNVCKYSQSFTRVYMDVFEKDGKAVITFRNISKYELNISSEELMERFVRGDSSRNTEGSGLGLSIARSLVELQNGQMELEVDGDLFKVILTFDAI